MNKLLSSSSSKSSFFDNATLNHILHHPQKDSVSLVRVELMKTSDGNFNVVEDGAASSVCFELGGANYTEYIYELRRIYPGYPIGVVLDSATVGDLSTISSDQSSKKNSRLRGFLHEDLQSFEQRYNSCFGADFMLTNVDEIDKLARRYPSQKVILVKIVDPKVIRDRLASHPNFVVVNPWSHDFAAVSKLAARCMLSATDPSLNPPWKVINLRQKEGQKPTPEPYYVKSDVSVHARGVVRTQTGEPPTAAVQRHCSTQNASFLFSGASRRVILEKPINPDPNAPLYKYWAMVHQNRTACLGISKRTTSHGQTIYRKTTLQETADINKELEATGFNDYLRIRSNGSDIDIMLGMASSDDSHIKKVVYHTLMTTTYPTLNPQQKIDFEEALGLTYPVNDRAVERYTCKQTILSLGDKIKITKPGPFSIRPLLVAQHEKMKEQLRMLPKTKTHAMSQHNIPLITTLRDALQNTYLQALVLTALLVAVYLNSFSSYRN